MIKSGIKKSSFIKLSLVIYEEVHMEKYPSYEFQRSRLVPFSMKIN